MRTLKIVKQDQWAIQVKCPVCRQLIPIHLHEIDAPNACEIDEKGNLHPSYVVCMNQHNGRLCNYADDIRVA